MRALIVILALALILAAGLYVAGVFDPAPADEPEIPAVTPEEPDVPTPTDEGADGPEDPEGPDGLATADPTPGERPALERTSFPEGSRALVIARRKLPETALARQVLSAARVPFQTWYLNVGADDAVGEARGLEPLATMPTADFLLDMEVTLLVVDNVDPNDMPDTFWAAVRERVGLGSMGLLMRAYPPYSPSGDPKVVVHPMLTHDGTRRLIPVDEALSLEGRTTDAGQMEVPGLFSERRPFTLTDAGLEHPATRLSRWTRWNRSWWNHLFEGERALGTKFVYPVTSLKDGSVALLGVTPKVGDDMPAFIVGPAESGRVLWIGVGELGWDFFHNSESTSDVSVALHNLFAWLAGGEPADLDAE